MATRVKSKNNINTAEFGRKYYDVLDVYKQKVMSQIVEKSRELNIDKATIKVLDNILVEETAQVKNWGFDQLIKVVKD
tara:strand:- start:128 stop:361 length:234 start_codon:yes stop_codon:yes gene_type:complete